MGSVLFKVSDLTGEIVQPEQEDQLRALVIEQHPDYEEAITLEISPEDIEGQLPEPTELVLVSYNAEQYLLPVEQFELLFRNQDSTAVLERALAAQQEERSRSRGRRSRTEGQFQRQRNRTCGITSRRLTHGCGSRECGRSTPVIRTWLSGTV